MYKAIWIIHNLYIYTHSFTEGTTERHVVDSSFGNIPDYVCDALYYDDHDV